VRKIITYFKNLRFGFIPFHVYRDKHTMPFCLSIFHIIFNNHEGCLFGIQVNRRYGTYLTIAIFYFDFEVRIKQFKIGVK
jgi:hypothetical protein